MINESMLKQLKTGLKSLKTAEAALDQMTNQMIEQLPGDKKKEASTLISNAKKGKVDVGQMMKFADGVRDIDKEKFQEAVEKGIEKVEQKKKDIKAEADKKKKTKVKS